MEMNTIVSEVGTLVDIRDVSVNKELSRDERIAEFVQQIKIHTILSVAVLLYRPAFLLKVLPWKNVSRVFYDRRNFKKGADFSVKAW